MFEESIQKFINDNPGFWGGVIIGIDGIPVEQRTVSEKINLETAATEYITLLKQANQINEQERIGMVNEIIFVNLSVLIIIHHITAEYYFLGAFSPDSTLGEIRYKITKFTDELAKEFS
ncbi:MAG: hypothetical protein JW737_09825 [Acidobacteria bacterium]|nr:hypothetical protein [Acidobacteriota bacterium]